MKLIIHLLLLELQLFFIWQVLPLTSSTGAEVFAEWFSTLVTFLYKTNYFALGKRVLLATYLNVADVARHTEWYKHYQLVPMEQTLALGSNCLYRYILK